MMFITVKQRRVSVQSREDEFNFQLRGGTGLSPLRGPLAPVPLPAVAVGTGAVLGHTPPHCPKVLPHALSDPDQLIPHNHRTIEVQLVELRLVVVAGKEWPGSVSWSLLNGGVTHLIRYCMIMMT